MSKKIVIITGSPRKNGNSFAMTETFINAAEAKGLSVIRFDAALKKAGGCRACDNRITFFICLRISKGFTLSMGDYGQVICNGRFVDIDFGWWWYEMEIVNIRIVPKDSIHLDCFLSKEPTYIYKQMALLW